MALRPEEIDRLKFELGVSPARIGAEPFLAYLAIFDRVIQPYIVDNSATVATSTAAGLVTIALSANPIAANAASGMLTFNVGTSVVVDVGPLQEVAVITALSGLNATLTLANAHVGPFPIYPNGVEQMVRDLFARLDSIKAQITNVAPVTAGVSALVGEVTLSIKSSGRTRTRDKFESLLDQRMTARDDLAGVVGYANLWRMKPGGGGGGFTFEVY